MSRRQLEHLRIVRVVIEYRVVHIIVLLQQFPFTFVLVHFLQRLLTFPRRQFDSRYEVRIGDFFVGGVKRQVDPMRHGVVVDGVDVAVLVVELQ